MTGNQGIGANQGTLKLPPNYEQWKSTADADSDGFSVWEEYRGFDFWMDNVTVHERLDTNLTELVFQADDGMQTGYSDAFDKLQSSEFTNVALVSFGDINSNVFESTDTPEVLPPGPPDGQPAYDGDLVRNFIDFESDHFVESDWIHNELCTPPGMETFPWGENRSTIDIADIAIIGLEIDHSTLHPTLLGQTRPYYIVETSIRQNEDCAPVIQYPGGGGCGGIKIYEDNLHNHVDGLVADPQYNFPTQPPWDLIPYFKIQRTSRTITHEFGHAFGINHHCPNNYVGNRLCVMKYLFTPDDYPHGTPTPEDWIDFLDDVLVAEYMDDPYHCRQTVAMRPINSTEWPSNW